MAASGAKSGLYKGGTAGEGLRRTRDGAAGPARRHHKKHLERKKGEILTVLKYLVDPFPALEFFSLVPGVALAHRFRRIMCGNRPIQKLVRMPAQQK